MGQSILNNPTMAKETIESIINDASREIQSKHEEIVRFKFIQAGYIFNSIYEYHAFIRDKCRIEVTPQGERRLYTGIKLICKWKHDSKFEGNKGMFTITYGE